MAKVEFVGIDSRYAKIQQGDYVYCKAEEGTGALSFWGIYSEKLNTVISLDGAGSSCVVGKNIYLGEKYSYWTVAKRIPQDKAIIKIDERIE